MTCILSFTCTLSMGIHIATPSTSATVKMSLSPRPERLTRMVWSARMAGAILIAAQIDLRVGQKGVEDPDRVRAAADAGDDGIRQAPGRGDELLARLAPDHALEVAHHRRVGVRAERRAEQIVGVGVGDPVAHGLV